MVQKKRANMRRQKRLNLARFGPNNCFGEHEVLKRLPHRVTQAMTTQDTELFSMDKKVLIVNCWG